MASDEHYLACMNQCMGHILEATRHGINAVMDSVVVRDATLWNIHLVSYAARQLSDQTTESHPEIDWQALRELSGVLIKDPWAVDLNRVADYVQGELPAVKERLQPLLVSRRSK